MNLQEDPKALLTVKDIMLTNKEYFKKLIPQAMNHDRFIVASLSVLRQQPSLMTCSPSSFFGALVQCAQLGLLPGVLGLAYFVPFWNRKDNIREVQLIPGYKGLMNLAYRSERIAMIDAHTVREQDHFTIQYGTEPKIEHVPHESGRGGLKGFYCVISLVSGKPLIQYMTLEEVEAHKMKYSKAAKDGPWVTDYEPMCLKTVIRKGVKFAPMSTELARGVFLDETAESQGSQDLSGDVYDWKGLDALGSWNEKAQDPVAEEGGSGDDPFAVTAPPFGAFANKPLGLIPSNVLKRYRTSAEKSIADKKYVEENQRRIAAIDLVVAARSEVEAACLAAGVAIKQDEILGDADALEKLKVQYAKQDTNSQNAQAEVPEVSMEVDTEEA